MGPHGIFCHGASFYSGKSRFHVHVQGLRNIRYPNCLLDFCHHVTVDIKVPLESFFRNVSYEKIFRCRHPVTEWIIIRYSSSLIKLRLFAISISTMAVIALSGATHDIACDGVYMAELSPENQAKYIGVQGAFYNIAKLVANGGLVAAAGMLAEHFGASEDASIQANMPAYKEAWMIIFIIISALLLLLGLYHSKVLPSTQVPNQEKRSSSDVAKELWKVIKNFFTKKHIFYYICFIILYRFAEGFIMKIAPLFLRSSRDIGGLGLSLTEIGTLNGVFGSAAFVLGSLLAGVYVSRRGLKKTLFTLCCVFNFPFVAYTLLAIFQPENLYLIGTGIVIEYFGYGFGFVGLTLFMMQQIAPGKHQMSHYAFASGIMNLGVMLPGMMSGFFSDWLGYERFFIYVLLATIPSLLITYFIPFTYDDSKKESNR